MNEEELKHITNMFNDAIVRIDNKIGELSKATENTIEKKKEYAEGKISENVFAYMAGSFVGGAIVGYVMGRKKSN